MPEARRLSRVCQLAGSQRGAPTLPTVCWLHTVPCLCFSRQCLKKTIIFNSVEQTAVAPLQNPPEIATSSRPFPFLLLVSLHLARLPQSSL